MSKKPVKAAKAAPIDSQRCCLSCGKKKSQHEGGIMCDVGWDRRPRFLAEKDPTHGEGQEF